MHLVEKRYNILVSIGELKNVTEDNINVFYSRQGAQAPTVLHC